MGAWVYILQCRDGKYYVGSYRGSHIENRVGEHNAGTYRGYTFSRRPVELLWANEFQSIAEAVRLERQLKGWSRAKKEAFMADDVVYLKDLSKRRT